jgi:hypothetical protein
VRTLIPIVIKATKTSLSPSVMPSQYPHHKGSAGNERRGDLSILLRWKSDPCHWKAKIKAVLLGLVAKALARYS